MSDENNEGKAVAQSDEVELRRKEMSRDVERQGARDGLEDESWDVESLEKGFIQDVILEVCKACYHEWRKWLSSSA